MTTIPTEAQNLLDAALEAVICRRKSATGYDTDKADKALSVAADAYRATQAPKDCRPPDNRPGYYWIELSAGLMEPMAWSGTFCSAFGRSEIIDPMNARELGWTVHSEVKFGEPAGVVATEMPIKLAVVRKTAGGSVLIVAGIEVLSWFGTSSDPTEVLAEEINAGFAERYGAHFRAPKLEISDEETVELANNCGLPTENYRVELVVFKNAVIAKVGGEK